MDELLLGAAGWSGASDCDPACRATLMCEDNIINLAPGHVLRPLGCNPLRPVPASHPQSPSPSVVSRVKLLSVTCLSVIHPTTLPPGLSGCVGA